MHDKKYKERSGKNILMFAPFFAPYSFSESIVNSKLALAFQQNGWHIDIISRAGEGPHYSAERHELWRPLQQVTHEISYSPGNKVSRLIDLVYQSFRTKYPIDGVRWAARAIDLSIELHKKNPYQLVLSRSPNDIGHVPALEFTKQTKIPWIANWNDPPAHNWPLPYKSVSNVLKRRAFQRLMNRVLNKADAVTFPAERLCQHFFKKEKRAGPKKSIIIPHIGLSGYSPPERNADGCFRICHAGNLSRERDPASFFDGIAHFVKNATMHHHFEICIIGTSSHELTTLAETYGIAKYFKFTGGLNYVDTLAALGQSDVLLVIEAPCREGLFLPSKVADYAMIGRPILSVSPLNGTMADLIRDTGAGQLAICGEPESVANAMANLYESWLGGCLEKSYPPSALRAQFNPEKIIQKYNRLFSELGEEC